MPNVVTDLTRPFRLTFRFAFLCGSAFSPIDRFFGDSSSISTGTPITNHVFRNRKPTWEKPENNQGKLLSLSTCRTSPWSSGASLIGYKNKNKWPVNTKERKKTIKNFITHTYKTPGRVRWRGQGEGLGVGRLFLTAFWSFLSVNTLFSISATEYLHSLSHHSHHHGLSRLPHFNKTKCKRIQHKKMCTTRSINNSNMNNHNPAKEHEKRQYTKKERKKERRRRRKQHTPRHNKTSKKTDTHLHDKLMFILFIDLYTYTEGGANQGLQLLLPHSLSLSPSFSLSLFFLLIRFKYFYLPLPYIHDDACTAHIQW